MAFIGPGIPDVKPRLEPPELTPEDLAVFGIRVLRLEHSRVVYVAHTLGLYHDSRDATIMYVLERARKLGQLFRPADYPYVTAHCLMRAEARDSGTFDWVPK